MPGVYISIMYQGTGYPEAMYSLAFPARVHSHEIDEARRGVMKCRGRLQWALLHDHEESVEGARLET